jgi:LmbE family N-acetylglucosaminyl deacetylase
MSAGASLAPPEFRLGRVLVVSPHLDDAVFSCTTVLASAPEALVVTVFAATPDPYPKQLTVWDRACGFAPDDDVVAQRRMENEAALDLLDAAACNLDFVDDQYRREPVPTRDVAQALRDVVEGWQPDTVLVPFGLRHRDHRIASAAALATRAGSSATNWIAYVEFPYAWLLEDLAARRITAFQLHGYRLTPVVRMSPAPATKAAALACYRSQVLGSGLGDDDLAAIASAPELLWKLTDRPALAASAVRRGAYLARRAWQGAVARGAGG